MARRKMDWVAKTIILSKPIAEKLREVSKKYQVSESEIIRRLLLEYFEKGDLGGSIDSTFE